MKYINFKKLKNSQIIKVDLLRKYVRGVFLLFYLTKFSTAAEYLEFEIKVKQ